VSRITAMAQTTKVSKVPRHSSKANSPLTVMYVEVNDTNFANAGCYNLTTGAPLFDIAIIFAANINFNTQERRAYLHFNNNVTAVLSDVEKYIRPLQRKGTKVLLSILGNHEGAGICNFQDVASARDFAQQLADACEEYGLDGIDFDDEYADYGNTGTGQPNAFSFMYLLRELRQIMPDKIISFYYYGPATSRLRYEDLIAGDFLDYSWNAMYGTYQPPNVPNLDRSQLGPAAIWVTNTSSNTARNYAISTVNDGYGVYLCYGLPNNALFSYMSVISEALYGVPTAQVDGCLQTWPPGQVRTKCPCCKQQ